MSERKCSVDGCGRKSHAKGFCNIHYIRYKRGRDPKDAPNGSGLTFLNAHVAFTGRECLEWPYGKFKSGYGAFRKDGDTCAAHRFMCRLAHGQPPFKGAEAAHSCGNRACVNPRHLRWATSAENTADMRSHGTMQVGAQCSWSKLTQAQAEHIIKSTESERKLAARLGCSRQTVNDIRRGKSWKWLTRPL